MASLEVENERLKADNERLKAELEKLRSQRCYYEVTYMGNEMNVFLCEKEANEYNDSLGGVYSVYEVNF